MRRSEAPRDNRFGAGDEHVPHRRGHTRWLMVAPLTALAIVIVGAIVLEAVTPLADPLEPVADIPPLAVDGDPRSCTRSTDDVTVEELRTEHVEATGRVSSSQIHRCPRAFDRLPVVFVGEVVGDLLRRRGGAWIQVNDDAYALDVGPLVGHRGRQGSNSGLSVWLPDGLHEQLDGLGRAGRRGDVVLLEGTVLRADPADGGGLTLRADDLQILAPTVEVEDPLHLVQAIVAAILAILALGVVVWSRHVR